MILVYTRPKVSTVRKRNTEYSWCKAFWKVVKAGVAVPPHHNPTFNHRDLSVGVENGNLGSNWSVRGLFGRRSIDSTSTSDEVCPSVLNHMHDPAVNHSDDEEGSYSGRRSNDTQSSIRNVDETEEILDSVEQSQGTKDF